MPQEVIRQPLIEKARVGSQATSRGVCGGHRDNGTGLAHYFNFPPSVSFHQYSIPALPELCSPRNTGVQRDVNKCSVEYPETKNLILLLLVQLALAYLITVYDIVHVRNFVRTFHLVAIRSRCVGFHSVNDGTTNILYVFRKYAQR